MSAPQPYLPDEVANCASESDKSAFNNNNTNQREVYGSLMTAYKKPEKDSQVLMQPPEEKKGRTNPRLEIEVDESGRDGTSPNSSESEGQVVRIENLTIEPRSSGEKNSEMRAVDNKEAEVVPAEGLESETRNVVITAPEQESQQDIRVEKAPEATPDGDERKNIDEMAHDCAEDECGVHATEVCSDTEGAAPDIAADEDAVANKVESETAAPADNPQAQTQDPAPDVGGAGAEAENGNPRENRDVVRSVVISEDIHGADARSEQTQNSAEIIPPSGDRVETCNNRDLMLEQKDSAASEVKTSSGTKHDPEGDDHYPADDAEGRIETPPVNVEDRETEDPELRRERVINAKSVPEAPAVSAGIATSVVMPPTKQEESSDAANDIEVKACGKENAPAVSQSSGEEDSADPRRNDSPRNAPSSTIAPAPAPTPAQVPDTVQSQSAGERFSFSAVPTSVRPIDEPSEDAASKQDNKTSIPEEAASPGEKEYTRMSPEEVRRLLEDPRSSDSSSQDRRQSVTSSQSRSSDKPSRASGNGSRRSSRRQAVRPVEVEVEIEEAEGDGEHEEERKEPEDAGKEFATPQQKKSEPIMKECSTEDTTQKCRNEEPESAEKGPPSKSKDIEVDLKLREEASRPYKIPAEASTDTVRHCPSEESKPESGSKPPPTASASSLGTAPCGRAKLSRFLSSARSLKSSSNTDRKERFSQTQRNPVFATECTTLFTMQ